MITGNNLEYLCGLLNSKLFIYYFKMLLAGDSYTYGSRDFFSNVPIKRIETDEQKRISSLVNILMSNDENNSEIIQQIDSLVYSIYDISEQEINYIENH